MRHDHFSMLPERAFQPRSGRFGMTLEGGGSGGGGQTSSTVTQTNIPEYARPYVESMLGATMKELFTTKPTGETVTPAKYGPEGELISPETRTPAGMEITGVKPFEPFSRKAEDYFAGFNPTQQQMFGEAAGMRSPGQFGQAAGMADISGQGGLSSAGLGYMYGGQGADIGQRAATMARQAAVYGRGAADIGQQGADVAGMGFGAGQRYEQMATDPRAMQSYMSPYMQNVVDVQKQQAVRDYQENIMPQIQAQATRAGAFGGSRDAVQRAMAQRGLAQQLQNIQATGTQQAFQQAQQAQQYGADLGLRGLGAGLQGLQTGIAGQQAGMQGVQGALAGTSQALQGAQLGLQGVGAAQAGYGLAGQQAANLANIGSQQQAADISRMQFQGQVGAQQQQREQDIINQRIQDYAMQKQYPQQQLAFMNAMLRGLPMQATTTQSYMPPPSPFSQFAGAGMSTYSLGKLGGFFKEGGKVKEKKYAEGGITSIDQKVINDPTSYSPEMINKGIASGAISKMAGAIGLSAIENAKKQAQSAQARQAPAPQGTILGDLQQQAAGIDSLPSNLPTQQMAGGGIIAFEDGGEVVRAQEGLYVNPYLANYIRQMETGGLRDPDAAVSPKGARGIMQIMPATAMKPGFGVPNIFELADAAGVQYEGKTEDEAKRLLSNRNLNVAFGERYAGAMQKKFGDNPTLAAAAYNAGPGAVERAGGVPDIAETKKYVAGISPERFEAARKSVQDARREQLGLPSLPAKPAPAQPIPGAAAAIEQVGDITTRGVAEDRQRQFMDILGGRAPVPKRATPNDPTLMAEAAPPGMPQAPKAAAAPTPEAKPEEDSDIAALRKSIAARRGELGKQREQDKYMALLAAGLGMMGGTSKYALENIGKGAMQGVAAAAASRKEQREAEQDVLASELGLSRATLYEKMRVDQLKGNKEIAAAKNAVAQQLADIKKQQGYRDAADMWLNSPNRTALEADLQKRYGKNWKQDGKADLELSMARTKFIQELLSGGGLFGGNVQQANALLAR